MGAVAGGMLASAVLKVVFKQICAVIGGQIKLQQDFAKDLLKMKMTLESLAAVLKDAERKSVDNSSVQLWLKRLKNAMYDISDMLEEFETDTQPAAPKATGVLHEDVKHLTMHDLVHDLARLVLADELILGESKLGNTDGSSCRYALFDDCSKRMESYTDSPAKIKALRFLDCGKIGLHGDAFSSAKYIRVLDLSDCFIQELPDSVGQLKQLRYLNAPKIQHRMIPNSITKLLKLMYLSLRGSSALLEMPDSIGDLEDLMYLDLSCCSELEKLPESFSRLNKLVHLDLSNCTNVTGVSESLPSLTNLEFLDISYCWNIRELPEHFGSLLKLKYLNMSGCDEIEELPGSIGNIKNLVHLDLSHCCQVKVTPQVLDCLTKLQYLNLSQCGCIDGTKVAEALGNLTQLRQLHLSGFMDTMYHDESTFSTSLECISTLSYLEHLDISCNIGLLHLPERFGSLGKLHTLDLSDCSSLRFLPESIAQMDSLKRVYAKDCRPLVTQLLVARGLHKSLTPLMELDVQAGELKGGNLVLFHAVDVTAVKIYGLDEVESFEEAQSIKLVAKKGIEKLRLVWSVSSYHVRIVEDSEVLGGLEPPSTIESLDINGYNGIIFPDWLMCISHDNFPNLVCPWWIWLIASTYHHLANYLTCKAWFLEVCQVLQKLMRTSVVAL
ncbi:hypothetical protein BDA96_07G075300 [Sorghum bicolor]|uniref:Rx N-terminal domain-containing protein n=1 Tax=Sorghum bicolor TaxID=4558 RepID=A0A921QJ47_SORBI|nr:hypothetical protein BDA96_07G075300 [Sorghum bicolor]